MDRQRRTRRNKRELDVPESTRGRRLFNHFRPPRTLSLLPDFGMVGHGYRRFQLAQGLHGRALECYATSLDQSDDAVVEGIGGPSFICGSLATDEKLAGLSRESDGWNPQGCFWQ